jgi:hypothetical protein
MSLSTLDPPTIDQVRSNPYVRNHDPTGVSALRRLPATKHVNGAASSAIVLGAGDAARDPTRRPTVRILLIATPPLREIVVRLSRGGIERTSPRMDDSGQYDVGSY